MIKNLLVILAMVPKTLGENRSFVRPLVHKREGIDDSKRNVFIVVKVLRRFFPQRTLNFVQVNVITKTTRELTTPTGRVAR